MSSYKLDSQQVAAAERSKSCERSRKPSASAAVVTAWSEPGHSGNVTIASLLILTELRPVLPCHWLLRAVALTLRTTMQQEEKMSSSS